MRETLRLTPTAGKRAVVPLEDTTIGGGKYFVKAGQTVIIQVWNMHRDPLVWGEDVGHLLCADYVVLIDFVGGGVPS